jgi:hypothetical protein
MDHTVRRADEASVQIGRPVGIEAGSKAGFDRAGNRGLGKQNGRLESCYP